MVFQKRKHELIKRENSVLLKWLLIIGGVVEIVLGILFVFIHLFVGSMGYTIDVPLFSQIGGCALICFGYLLIYTTRDVKTYAIIPKINILLRFIVLPVAIYNVFLAPPLVPLIIGAAIYDVVWAIVVLILLRKLGCFMTTQSN